MRAEKKARTRDWVFIVVVAAGIIALVVIAATGVLRQPQAELTATAMSEDYVRNLTIAEEASCDQDHLVITGTAQRDNVWFQIIRVITADGRGSGPEPQAVSSPTLHNGDEFSLSSPLISEDSRQDYIVVVRTPDNNASTVADISTRPRCGGGEE